MQYRRLGKTELSVSAVGVGTWQFSGAWNKTFSQEEVDTLLRVAQEQGINFLDTAECYGANHLSESFIGAAIASERDRWIVATKFGHDNANGLGEENYAPAQVLKQLEDSLRALRTDYIDIYQLHSAPNRLFENADLWTLLDKQVAAGKIRFLGNSVPVRGMRKQVEMSNDYGVSVVQLVYNAVTRKAEEDAFPLVAELDLGVIARTPLASGLLSGNYQPGYRFPVEDVRCMFPQEHIDRDINAGLELLVSRPVHLPPCTWAAAWCLQQSLVSCVIPGVKSTQQLLEVAVAGDITL